MFVKNPLVDGVFIGLALIVLVTALILVAKVWLRRRLPDLKLTDPDDGHDYDNYDDQFQKPLVPPYVPPVYPPHPGKELQAAMRAIVDDPEGKGELNKQLVDIDSEGRSRREAATKRTGCMDADVVVRSDTDADIAGAYGDGQDIAARLQGPNRRSHANRHPMGADEVERLIQAGRTRQQSLTDEIRRDARREAEAMLDDEKRAALFAEGGQEAVNAFLDEVVSQVMGQVNAGTKKLAGRLLNNEEVVEDSRRLREGLFLTGNPRDENGYVSGNPVQDSQGSPASEQTGT